MSATTISRLHTWLTIIVSATALISFVKLAGANDRAIQEHERRIQLLESKFEKALENQATMAGDIRVIRAIIEQKHTSK